MSQHSLSPLQALSLDEKTLSKALLRLIQQEHVEVIPAKYPHHLDAVRSWVQALESGIFSGRPFSHHTVTNYLRYVRYFLQTYGQISIDGLEEEFRNTSVELFGRKDKFHRAIICFAKFLLQHHSLSQVELDGLLRLKPKRHKPPKRTTLTPEQCELLYAYAHSQQTLLLLKLIATTGLRASECCGLRLEDIDFENQILTVQCGKGGKRRRVGLIKEVLELLQAVILTLPSQEPTQHLFLNQCGVTMDRVGVLNRVRNTARKAGIKASPHALRRAFVTINANKGRSLVMLQIACGHSDIKTTRSYCQTSEDELINAMKNWS